MDNHVVSFSRNYNSREERKNKQMFMCSISSYLFTGRILLFASSLFNFLIVCNILSFFMILARLFIFSHLYLVFSPNVVYRATGVLNCRARIKWLNHFCNRSNLHRNVSEDLQIILLKLISPERDSFNRNKRNRHKYKHT